MVFSNFILSKNDNYSLLFKTFLSYEFKNGKHSELESSLSVEYLFSNYTITTTNNITKLRVHDTSYTITETINGENFIYCKIGKNLSYLLLRNNNRNI